jgi:hypothetical protein
MVALIVTLFSYLMRKNASSQRSDRGAPQPISESRILIFGLLLVTVFVLLPHMSERATVMAFTTVRWVSMARLSGRARRWTV